MLLLVFAEKKLFKKLQLSTSDLKIRVTAKQVHQRQVAAE